MNLGVRMSRLFDWSQIRFLESAGNLKLAMRARTGRTPSATVAREIATRLQHGRLYFEAAAEAPVEIRPLLLFYGMLAFATAMVLGRSGRASATLKHSHGLSDVSPHGGVIRDLAVRIEHAGTFVEFNDVVASLNRLYYYKTSLPTVMECPTTASRLLAGTTLTLKDILSRIPGLEKLYQATFSEPASTDQVDLHLPAYDGDDGGCAPWELFVTDAVLISDREALVSAIHRWRSKYSCLSRWRLAAVYRGGNGSTLSFTNVDPTQDEFEEAVLPATPVGFEAANDPRFRGGWARFDAAMTLPPMAGSFSKSAAFVVPVEPNKHVAEFSLYYMGLFLLSSLVRYRPEVWGHAISRTVTVDRPSDDEPLAVLERFLSLAADNVPDMVVKVLGPSERHQPHDSRPPEP